MALISCPECGNQISDRARACPHCGTPIAGGPPLESPGAPRSTNPALIVVIVLAVVIGGVFLVSIIAAMAIPTLLRSRTSSNEASAIASLRTLVTSEEQFKATDGKGLYTTLAQLGTATPPFIDPILSSGRKSGYSFVGDVGGDGRRYTFLAVPLVRGKTGNRTFFVDASGVIRFSASTPAGPNSPPIE